MSAHPFDSYQVLGLGEVVGEPTPAPPPAHPYLAVEILAWQPRQPGLDFAVVDPGGALAVAGHVVHVEPDYESGVRAALGVRFQSAWDIGVSYTNLHSNAGALVAGAVVRATASHPAFNVDANVAGASASLDYDVFDLELGRCFHADETFQVRLFGGLRAARIEQGFQATYDGIDFNAGFVNHLSDFGGIGLRSGAEAHWHVVYGMSLFGRAAGSILAGEFETHFAESDAGVLVAGVRDDVRQTVGASEIALGLSWQGRHWSLQTGYEFVTWFNMLQRPVFHDDVHVASFSRRQGNLGLDGVFVRLAYDW